MRQMFKRKIVWLLVAAGVATMAVINFKSLIDFFLPEANLNELITRTISIQNSLNKSETVVFKIAQGFLTSHVPREGESIVLHVGYPNKSYVTQAMYSDQKQQIVSIHIAAGNVTVGDNFKSAIDNGTLESRYRRTVLRIEGVQFFLRDSKSTQNERNDFSQLFYDAYRQHWINSRLTMLTRSSGEGVLKTQPILVSYSYNTDLEPNPVVMHEWVMNFVESRQVNILKSTQGK